MKKYIVKTDGASRGNPGPASLGVAFYDERENLLKTYSEYLGEKTNNEAEYLAAVTALLKFKSFFGKKEAKKSEVEIRTDSQLLAKQMKGKYKVKDEKMQRLFVELWNLTVDFGRVVFKSVPREENTKADELANQALDRGVQGKLV